MQTRAPVGRVKRVCEIDEISTVDQKVLLDTTKSTLPEIQRYCNLGNSGSERGAARRGGETKRTGRNKTSRHVEEGELCSIQRRVFSEGSPAAHAGIATNTNRTGFSVLQKLGEKNGEFFTGRYAVKPCGAVGGQVIFSISNSKMTRGSLPAPPSSTTSLIAASL
ncbi:hypothetical protein, variant [Exophiala dermatitidis NIH/UT8656]|uniref:Uncharacterized protein n=1 Tax=Exophiala dermatitidis (strain ATCC 34100 / CBS 525.76 / NIH/UT8656) TaxID=858893 RepID=H6C5E2_EXODN|nr:uncharacterized protein HMPREF1120_06988 [Exophiala dermatitidis NIH/UT8656]XP_009159449.1 hypothetical protein, variant [Exophiala dermatitidis NIH/UT8656]EHY58987.1 hypothetical protein, variant [Exophiala dermatitidis NIH/UT8656]EHY58988.1 hypothetical protein HMPREF1120_06988 [Exophiala dermatitidis NIH/UT8656]